MKNNSQEQLRHILEQLSDLYKEDTSLGNFRAFNGNLGMGFIIMRGLTEEEWVTFCQAGREALDEELIES